MDNFWALMPFAVGFTYAILFYYILYRQFKSPLSNSLWLPLATTLMTTGMYIYYTISSQYGWEILGATIMIMMNGLFILGYAIPILYFRYFKK